MITTPARRTALAALAVLALAGCSSAAAAGTVGTPVAQLPAELPAGPSGPPVDQPTPQPTGSRTPAELAAQVEVTAPDESDPALAAAVAAYRDFRTQLVVAQGLPDGSWAPLIARVEPAAVTSGLASMRQVVAAGEVILGPYHESVQEVAASNGTAYLSTCTDFTQRRIHDRRTGAFRRAPTPARSALIVTLRHDTGSWRVSAYEQSTKVVCP